MNSKHKQWAKDGLVDYILFIASLAILGACVYIGVIVTF
jgi:hypothetical protein